MAASDSEVQSCSMSLAKVFIGIVSSIKTLFIWFWLEDYYTIQYNQRGNVNRS